MNPGELKHRITFVQEQDDRDDEGFPATVPTDITTVWAKKITLKGRRFYEAAAVQMQDQFTFRLRYNRQVESLHEEDKTMRIRYKEKMYTIESLTNDDGLNRWMTVIVKEVV